MFPSPHRAKGGAPLLGASAPGEQGPFGRWPEDVEPEPDDDEDGGLGDEPEPTSHVDAEVQRRIAEAKVRIAATKARRESLAAARKHGLARRHAQRIRNLRDAEQRRSEGQGD